MSDTIPPGGYDPTSTYGAPPAPAGFWRRLWSAQITGVAFAFVADIVVAVLAFATAFSHDATESCRVTASGRSICTKDDVVVVAGVAVIWIVLVALWHLWYTRPLATRGATIGMRQMGLSIHRIGTSLPMTRSLAVRRNLPKMLLATVAYGALPLVYFTAEDSLLAIWAATTIVLFLVVVAGAVAMLFDERRRTLWDRFAGTVVTTDRGPSWIALAAFQLALLVRFGLAYFLVDLGADRIRDEFNDLTGSPSELVDRSPLAALLVVWVVVTLVLGHIGLRQTRWESSRFAGRGLAMTALVLGYAVPVVVALLAVAGATVERIDDVGTKNCREARREIITSLDSYRMLNGRPPASLSEIERAEYLGERAEGSASIGEKWDYLVVSAAPDGYELTGIEECADD